MQRLDEDFQDLFWLQSNGDLLRHALQGGQLCQLVAHRLGGAGIFDGDQRLVGEQGEHVALFGSGRVGLGEMYKINAHQAALTRERVSHQRACTAAAGLHFGIQRVLLDVFDSQRPGAPGHQFQQFDR